MQPSLRPVPRLFNIWLMEVAVTLSLGGNQAADTAGGADWTTMLGIPLSRAPRWQSRVKSDSERAGKTRKTQRTEVPRAIRELDSKTDALREAEIVKSRTDSVTPLHVVLQVILFGTFARQWGTFVEKK